MSDERNEVIKKTFLGLGLLAFWIFLGVFLFAVVEKQSLMDAVYGTVITLTGIGYGDVIPKTDLGKDLAIILAIGGRITEVYVLVRVGQVIFEGELLRALGVKKMKKDLKKMEGHYIICGYGRMANTIIEGLLKEDKDFCIVDMDSSKSELLKELEYIHVTGDCTDEAVLRAAGIDRARALIALLPSDANNLYLTMSAKEANKDVIIIACAMDEKAEKRIRSAGAERIISPYKVASEHVLHAAVNLDLGDSLLLGNSKGGGTVSLCEFEVCSQSVLIGQSIKDSAFRQQYGALVVALNKAGDDLMVAPDPDSILEVGDQLVVAGVSAELRVLQRVCSGLGSVSEIFSTDQS